MTILNSRNKMRYEKLNIICLMYLIAWAFIPLFSYYTSGSIFKLFYAVVVIVWFITGIANMDSKMFFSIFSMFIFLLIMFIYYIIGFGNLSLFGFVDYILLFGIGIHSSLYVDKISRKGKIRLKKYIVMCIGITLCTTVNRLYIDPNSSRLLTSSSTDKELVKILEKANVGGFDFIYGIVIIIPILLYMMTQSDKKKEKIIYFSLSILGSICVVKSNFTTAYLLLVVDVILYLFFRYNSLSGKILSVILFIIFLMFGKNILQVYFEFLINNTTSIWSKAKLNGILDLLNGHGTIWHTTGRTDLILRDLNSFLQSPVIGNGAYYGVGSSNFIGQHSQFLDEMARFGLIGAIPLFYFLYSCMKQTWNSISHKVSRHKFVSATIVFIILGFLNPIFNDGILFFYFIVIPILIAQKQVSK